MRRPGIGFSAVPIVAVLVALTAPAAASGAVQLDRIGGDHSFDEPVYASSDPTDHNRVLVAELTGQIKLVEDDEVAIFADLTEPVQYDVNGTHEDGLLSFAFAPDFATSRRMYVAYVGSEDTATADPGYLHVDQLTVNAAGDGLVGGSRREVLVVPNANDASSFHYAGQLQFGPDGYLYLSTGDGGPSEDPNNRAQDLGDLHGKLLRVDPDPSGGYSIPAGNPFAGVAGAHPEIWSLGLRNPWRFSFDRLTGALTIADVGHETREEVNLEPRSAGAGRARNFGWNCREGTFVPDFGHGPCGGSYRDPVFEQEHPDGWCSSITGGYVVRDPGLEELAGRYVYADYCRGEIRSVVLAGRDSHGDRREATVDIFGVVSFGEDACGRIYAVHLSGSIYRLHDGTAATAAECVGQASPPADNRAPAVRVRGGETQRLGRSGRIELRFRSDEDAALEVGGKVAAVGDRSRGARVRAHALAGHAVGLRAWVRVNVKWKLGRRRASRFKQMIRDGRRVRVRVTYTVTDTAGNSTEGERRVKLVRG